MTPEGPATDVTGERAASEPPEARGLTRDGVRLMVVSDRGLEHARFRDLPRFLRPGDVVVVNTSATIPAALDAVRSSGRSVVVHLSTRLDDGTWVLEMRSPDGSTPLLDAVAGERLDLPDGAHLEIASAHAGLEGRARLLRARPDGGSARDLLERFGRPISYGYVRGRWPLSMYQTVFARHAGSAEMPSAGRPFTGELVARLVAEGIVFAPVRLHTGVSSLEARETPPPERLRVPPETARLVNDAREAGAAIVAVGTTVTRALETAADARGVVAPTEGWTDLVLGPDRPARVVTGLITGWHASDSSHRLLLEAVAGRDLVRRAEAAARSNGYLWHEFGDSCLFVPRRPRPAARRFAAVGDVRD